MSVNCMHIAMHRPPRSRAVFDYNYRRTYKACIPCRERKVKCELEGESQQPCSRCERMKLHCRFTENRPWTRRKSGRSVDTRSHSRGLVENGLDQVRGQTTDKETNTYSDSNKNPVTALPLMFPTCNGPFNFFVGGTSHTSLSSFTNHLEDTTRSPGQTLVESDVLRVWSACRFVKMGWLTAPEAITLVNLFSENMSPLSPILTDFYNYPSNHYWLVTQEPMLCCTILMISSRYHVLPGFGGTSRAYSIHNRLWQHCQHLILRIILGQEKLSKAKTRHVGSIEALLLMAEWYPRALNFPPDNDGWDSDLILTLPDFRDPPTSADEVPMSDRWREDVVEPTRRSDRMSWMLVSTALALAHELGLFKAEQGVRKGPEQFEGAGMRSDAQIYLQHLEWRRRRLPPLLYVFGNLLSSRLGCTSLIPEMPAVKVLDSSSGDQEWIDFMVSWVDLTRLAKDITETHFPSTVRIDNQERITRPSRDWGELLSRWRHDRPTLANPHLDYILDIEYHYLQAFSNSIKVQSLVENILTSPDQSSPTDRTCINEVISASCTVLQSIINPPNIQYLPIRVFLRVIGSSIFLLKALALGVRTVQLYTSLNLFDQTIATLQSSTLDDMQLVSRYASLLQIHVSRLRETFKASAQEREKDAQEDEQIEGHPGMLPVQSDEFHVWDDPLLGQINGGTDDWFSLPFDPLMAPFGTWDDNGQLDYGLDSAYLDLDFIWNLPP